jgi:hypothetical protein
MAEREKSGRGRMGAEGESAGAEENVDGGREWWLKKRMVAEGENGCRWSEW